MTSSQFVQDDSSPPPPPRTQERSHKTNENHPSKTSSRPGPGTGTGTGQNDCEDEREYLTRKGKGKKKNAKGKGKAKAESDNEGSGSEFVEEDGEGEEKAGSEAEDDDENDGEGVEDDDEEEEDNDAVVDDRRFKIRYRRIEKGRVNAFSCEACIRKNEPCYSQASTKSRGSCYSCGKNKNRCIYPVCLQFFYNVVLIHLSRTHLCPRRVEEKRSTVRSPQSPPPPKSCLRLPKSCQFEGSPQRQKLRLPKNQKVSSSIAKMVGFSCFIFYS
jgi:hypothetical protein